MAISLYIHIPYCKSRCLYCDFCSLTDQEALTGYVDLLKKEYDLLMANYAVSLPFKTIFIGGGTPTALPINDFKALMSFVSALPKTIDYEWTVEANPESLTEAYLDCLYDAGCNRLSIGVQDLNPDILKSLGRIHSPDDFINAFQLARVKGFDNISADLMFGIPGQNSKSTSDTLAQLLELSPEHISAYSLKIEENTAMDHLVKEGRLRPMGEEEDRALYHLICRTLKKSGYHQYELSNFSLKGFESRHNLSYWHNEDFVALGLSSAYYMNKTRVVNTNSMDSYKVMIRENELPIGEVERNPVATEAFETLFLQLRLNEGLNIDTFAKRYELDFEEQYGLIVQSQIEKGLLIKDGKIIRLTDLGRDLSNQVFIAFILPEE